jgi:phosphoglycolate phosphatase
MIKAVLFDMDGTVLNTLEDIKNSVNFALNQFHLPLKSDQEIKLAVGNGAYTLIERVVPKTFHKDKIKEVFKVYQDYYDKHSNDHTGPYPGILELLKKLKEMHLKIGVVSNKFEYLVKELNISMFDQLFDVSIGEVKGIPIKPEPDMIYKALDILNISKNEAVFLGDTSTDIQTAKNAGLKSIGVLWGFRDEKELIDHGADYIISHPLDLLSIIKEVKI